MPFSALLSFVRVQIAGPIVHLQLKYRATAFHSNSGAGALQSKCRSRREQRCEIAIREPRRRRGSDSAAMQDRLDDSSFRLLDPVDAIEAVTEHGIGPPVRRVQIRLE